jgi:hypothetical protein
MGEAPPFGKGLWQRCVWEAKVISVSICSEIAN